jgi:hypothetical protein
LAGGGLVLVLVLGLLLVEGRCLSVVVVVVLGGVILDGGDRGGAHRGAVLLLLLGLVVALLLGSLSGRRGAEEVRECGLVSLGHGSLCGGVEALGRLAVASGHA